MVLLIWVLLGLAGGASLFALGRGVPADWVWSITALPVAAHVAIGVVRSLLGGKLGVDVIALAAILAAVVMGEPLTGAVVALMVAGGEAVEGWAEGRATRALTALLARAPRYARDGKRHRGDRRRDDRCGRHPPGAPGRDRAGRWRSGG